MTEDLNERHLRRLLADAPVSASDDGFVGRVREQVAKRRQYWTMDDVERPVMAALAALAVAVVAGPLAPAVSAALSSVGGALGVVGATSAGTALSTVVVAGLAIRAWARALS